MKILYLITRSDLGGAQKNALDLAVTLKKRHKITIAAGPACAKASAGKDDGDGALFDALTSQNIKSIQLKYLRRAINPIQDWLAFQEIKKLLQQEQPDILHLHSSKAGVLGSLAARTLRLRSENTIRIIYTVHGAVFTAAFSAFYRRLFLWLEKWTAKYKDKIICVSANDKNLWLKYRVAPAEKLTVIYNGIDLNNLQFLPREEAQKELKIQHTKNNNQINSKFIGTIANFYPEKGLGYLIEATNILKNDFHDLRTIIIGEGEQRPILENLIKKYRLRDSVILTGGLPNAPRYIKAFDVFVLPSIKEGLPYAILEAMAAGVPIVASEVGGVSEMVANGQNGFLVPPTNPEILARKIAELLNNPALREKFSQNSLIKIKDFSLAKMAEKTEKIYSL